MKKFFIGLGTLGALFFILLVIARLTGMLQFYTIPTPSNYPNIKQGETVFTTNTKEAGLYKFIVFTSEYEDSVNASFMPDFKPGAHYLYRLCGVPGDMIEMKNGRLYVNHDDFDKALNLCTQYIISTADYNLIEQEDLNNIGLPGGSLSTKDAMVVSFDNTLVTKYKSRVRLNPYLITDTSNGSFKWYDKNSIWTPDNFGPLKIPYDCYFVLGDNRHNALDSRYTGFVKKENIKGVVLYK